MRRLIKKVGGHYMANVEDINTINRVIENYFNNNPTITSIRPKNIMPYLIEADVFNKDHRAGLSIRALFKNP